MDQPPHKHSSVRLVREFSPHQREWRNDPSIMVWCRQNELISEEDQKRWEERIKTDKSIQMFGIELNEKISLKIGSMKLQKKPTIIGACGLTGLTLLHRTGEFSLFIGPPFQRKGYGREALLELLKYGFLNLGLETIYGESYIGNPAIKMFHDVGMKDEGIHRSRYFKQGKRIDALSISITKDEYFAKYPI